MEIKNETVQMLVNYFGRKKDEIVFQTLVVEIKAAQDMEKTDSGGKHDIGNDR